MKDRREVMASTKRRYSREEFAQRGDAMYENAVRPHLKPDDNGKFAAIDIETGEYEIDADDVAALERLSKRVPSAQTWLVRIGSRYLDRFGARNLRGAK
jgi:hypothetical protein